MNSKQQFQDFVKKVYLNRLVDGETNLVRFYSLCGAFIPFLGYLFLYNGKVYPIQAMIGFSIGFGFLFVGSFYIDFVQRQLSRLFMSLFK